MTMLLILDKSVLHGTSTGKLCELAHNYKVVVPYTLCVESLKNQSQERLWLLKRIRELVKSGAYLGSSPFSLIEQEKKIRQPVDSVVDENLTNFVREQRTGYNSHNLDSEAAEYERSCELIVQKLLKLGEEFYRTIEQKKLLKQMRCADMNDKTKRFSLWLEAVSRNMNKYVAKFDAGIANVWDSRWYTWHYYRIRWTLALDWAWHKAESGCIVSDKCAVHDFHDIEYVTYLSKVDGLLTNDKSGLSMCNFARAAFPEKTVFSNIDEVLRT